MDSIPDEYPSGTDATAEEVTLIDTDVDGVADAYGVDTDDDNVDDTWVIDSNQNAVVDGVARDVTGDAVPDIVAFDADESGVLEAAVIDTDDDQVFDTAVTDLDENEVIDQLETAPEGQQDPTQVPGGATDANPYREPVDVEGLPADAAPDPFAEGQPYDPTAGRRPG